MLQSPHEIIEYADQSIINAILVRIYSNFLPFESPHIRSTLEYIHTL